MFVGDDKDDGCREEQLPFDKGKVRAKVQAGPWLDAAAATATAAAVD
jgi:hypothetical protein